MFSVTKFDFDVLTDLLIFFFRTLRETINLLNSLGPTAGMVLSLSVILFLSITNRHDE